VSALPGEREQALRLTTHAPERGLSMLITQAASRGHGRPARPGRDRSRRGVAGAVDELVPGLLERNRTSVSASAPKR
jgi:hypothetical protein